jgi:Fur family zinc uptake transcriptional regulator
MLTNDRIVLKILKNNKKRPLSAYDVLDKFLRIKRVQPATVYRSLKNLLDQKLIHRLNQSKKYIVCNESHNENDVTTIVLCESCYEYEEININRNKMSLAYNILDLKNFELNNFSVEIVTKCKKC